MKKSKAHPNTFSANELVSQLGAWVLTAAALLASAETLHHEFAAVPATASGAVHHAPTENLSARAEGARETARLPEEYDVGLRAPTISGV